MPMTVSNATWIAENPIGWSDAQLIAACKVVRQRLEAAMKAAYENPLSHRRLDRILLYGRAVTSLLETLEMRHEVLIRPAERPRRGTPPALSGSGRNLLSS